MRRLPVAALALIALALFSVPGLAKAQVTATPGMVVTLCFRPVAATPTCVLVDGTHGLPVSIAGGGAQTSPSSAAETNVAGNASPVTLLAANTSRVGATVYNDSTSVLYLLLGTGTVSSTVHTAQLLPGTYYEVPFGFTGIIKGVWVSANGAARVTEVTP